MKRTILAVLSLALLCSCSTGNYTSYVDPFIGSGGHGHVFVGASVPFGAVQLGPTSIPRDWDWCSGYHESDSSVIGFSHTHLSGTGCGDLCDITLLPVVGRDFEYSRTGIAVKADRTKEVCVPGYYSVPLLPSGILTEMTATTRVGLSRYTFPAGSQDAAIVLDLATSGGWDITLGGQMDAPDNTHISGYLYTRGWARDHYVYFAAEFSQPFTAYEEFGSNGRMYYRFNFADPGTVMVKVALSPSSSESAVRNMAAELPGWNFEAVRRAADKAWNAELGKVKIKTSDSDARTVFYTALYHTMIAPSVYSDAGEPVRYTTLSLWDTYRAAMPLYTILHPEKEDDMMATFLDIYDAQGRLPVWHLHGNETFCMVGNPGISVMADAITKGFCGFDTAKAYEAMKVSALKPDRGQKERMELGYIPFDAQMFSLAYDFEYAIADWALAQVAASRGEQQDYEYFLNRSRSWRRYFDPSVGFVRGLDSDGSFVEPFNPFYANHYVTEYCEGNAWQYTWLAPHDLDGLVECFGGKDKLISKLDSLFVVSAEVEGEDAPPDISGLIGQYAHGNEPSHHVLYFYTMLGQPWKTADLVRKVCSELYTTSTDGLSGNEDVGQMSAWYVLSAMGFYQVEPAGGRYFFGSPLFDKVSVALPGGRTFRIIARGNSAENRYIGSVKLDGKPLDRPWIDYRDIMSASTLEFTMSPTPGES